MQARLSGSSRVVTMSELTQVRPETRKSLRLIETIEHGGAPLCLIVSARSVPDETTFYTPPEFNLQAGHIVYPKGGEIPRHRHHPIKRIIVGTPEVLLVRKGRCQVDIYSDDEELVASRELREGDVIVIIAGGHGFRMLEDTVFLEIKQGPYPGTDEKVRF